MAILWGTFSTKNICTKKYLQRFKDEPHTLEIHFSNEAGRRNGRLGKGELFPSLTVGQYNKALERKKPFVLKEIRLRAKAIAFFFENYGSPKTRLILSTGLEDNYTRKAFENFVRVIREEIPTSVILTRSPLHSTRFFPGAHFIELHGDTPDFPSGAPCISNLDGTDISFGDDRRVLNGAISISEVHRFLKRTRSCARLIWWSASQGIERGRFIKPRSRNFRIHSQNINAVNRLLRQNQ